MPLGKAVGISLKHSMGSRRWAGDSGDLFPLQMALMLLSNALVWKVSVQAATWGSCDLVVVDLHLWSKTLQYRKAHGDRNNETCLISSQQPVLISYQMWYRRASSSLKPAEF